MSKILTRLLIITLFLVIAFTSTALSQKAFAEDPTSQCNAEGGFCTSAGICNANPPPGFYYKQDSAGNQLCPSSPTFQVCCMAQNTNNEPACNTNVISACTNAFTNSQYNNSGSNVACYQVPWQGNTGTLYGCSQTPQIRPPDACEYCGGYAAGSICPISAGYENSADYFAGGYFCWMPIPNCSSGTVNCGACGGAPYNTCGANNGSQTCQHDSPQICYYSNFTRACTQNNCDAGNGYSCQSSKCAKTMGGIVTDSTTGNPIAGVVIAGGGTTDATGHWQNTNMPYNTAFTFTAPTAAGAPPCNAGFGCAGSGNTSPNPNAITGTVGGAGDCGMNCNFTYTPGQISGHVWIDNDHNGAQNGEPNAGSGILVQADTGGSGLYTFTDTNGNYLLNYLNTGSHTVYVHDFPGYKVTTGTQSVSLPPNPANINFGIAPAHSISGYVFTDWNYNNNFDAEDNSYIPPPAVNVIESTGGGLGLGVANVPVIADFDMTLQNPSFETAGTPPSGWNAWITAPAAGTITQDCTTSDGGACSAHANITTANPSGYWYFTLAQQNLSLTANTAYEVTFYAKASAARPIWVYLQQATAPWVGYGWYHPTLTTGWAKYRFVFTSDYSDTATNLEFEFAEAAGDVWIDNVSIRPMSYTVPKMYDGTYNATLNPLPVATKQSPPVPNPVTVSGADITYENLGISPLYSAQGNVYNDQNRDACYEPAYDPLYTLPGTNVVFKDSVGASLTFPVTNGTYNTGLVLHAGTWTATYAVPTPYVATYPPVGFNVTVGNPNKSVACDTTLAQNPVCW